MGVHVESARSADRALRGILHGVLEDEPVSELDGLLVELVHVLGRCSGLAARIDRALAHRLEADRLRLDHNGTRAWTSPEVAVLAVGQELREAGLVAGAAGRHLDTARQITSTIGLAFDESDDQGGGRG